MFPVTRSFLDPQVLSRLSAIPLHARFAMQGNVSGRHASPHRGSSVEFAEYRKYVPGDDLRRLDWRAFGRTDRYYVKEFEADTNLRCCIILDTSGSMAFCSKGNPAKLQYARCLAGTLAYLATQQGDAIGVACAANQVVSNIPPRRSPAHLKVVLDTLENAKAHGDTQLPSILHEVAETVRQRALVVVISDLFVDPVELRSCFEHLRFRKHDVVVFHLLDPQEVQFEFQRPIRFLDMEGGSSIFIDPSEITDRYLRALQEYLNALKTITVETGVDYHRVITSEHYEQPLMRCLIGRTRSRGVR
jgi:uncharacterized protein (DUF58 family)